MPNQRRASAFQVLPVNTRKEACHIARPMFEMKPARNEAGRCCNQNNPMFLLNTVNFLPDLSFLPEALMHLYCHNL
mgnify:FL=1